MEKLVKMLSHHARRLLNVGIQRSLLVNSEAEINALWPLLDARDEFSCWLSPTHLMAVSAEIGGITSITIRFSGQIRKN